MEDGRNLWGWIINSSQVGLVSDFEIHQYYTSILKALLMDCLGRQLSPVGQVECQMLVPMVEHDFSLDHQSAVQDF
jgi:hypothetical protein